MAHNFLEFYMMRPGFSKSKSYQSSQYHLSYNLLGPSNSDPTHFDGTDGTAPNQAAKSLCRFELNWCSIQRYAQFRFSASA